MANYTIVEIKRLLKMGMVRSNGLPTKFAKKYAIKDPSDYVKFFKDLKEDFKKDRENIAFGKIIDFTKSVVGRLQVAIGVFGAFVYVLRVFGAILDDLRILEKVVRELEKELKTTSKKK